jgi:hypothetical protein
LRPSGYYTPLIIWVWTYGFFFVLVLEMAARKMMMTMMETAISAMMISSLGRVSDPAGAGKWCSRKETGYPPGGPERGATQRVLYTGLLVIEIKRT